MSTNDLLKDLDPDCPALNELCGRVDDQVKASGLRGKAAYAAESEQLTPLLAEHRATCDICRTYQPKPYFADRRLWPIFGGSALGYVVGLGGGSPQVGGGIGLGVGVLITLLMMRRHRRQSEKR
jgi:hypothetical protein